MPILAHGANNPCAGRCRTDAGQHGFSLLEVLLVLTIIGITSTAALAFFPSSDTQSLHREAQRLAQLFPLAQAEARTSGQTVVWETDAKGYRFIRLPRVLRLPPDMTAYLPTATRTTTMDEALRARPWPVGPGVHITVAPPQARRFDGEWLAGPMHIVLEQAGQRVVIERRADGRYLVRQ